MSERDRERQRESRTLNRKSQMSRSSRENLDNRERLTDSTPVDEKYFHLDKKAFTGTGTGTLYFNYREPF